MTVISALLAATLALTPQQVAPPVPWTVNPYNSFEWEGSPYVPFGVRISADPAEIARVAEAGIKDVLVELPLSAGVWQSTIKDLENRGLRYMITLIHAAPSAEVMAVEPESYRLGSLTGEVDARIKLPGAREAFVLLASEKTGALLLEETLPVTGGELVFKYPRPLTEPHVLIVYPIQTDLTTADYWSDFDSYRDRLLGTIRGQEFGPGFRGVVNPMGRTMRAFTNEDTFVPTSSYFQMEFQSFLEQKYGVESNVASAWKLSVSDMETMADFSRAVPLFGKERGIEKVYNLKSKFLTYASRESQMWADIREVMASGAARRYNNLVSAIRQATGRPVIQDWVGWGGPYQRVDNQLDGVGIKVSGYSLETASDDASRPTSSASRATKNLTSVVTDFALSAEGGPDLRDLVVSTSTLGVRGWFFRTAKPEQLAQIAALANTYRDDSLLAGVRPNVIFYPDAAKGLASPGLLPGGYVWLPGAGAGERLDLGEGLQGYRYVDDGQRILAFWAVGEPRAVRIAMARSEAPSYAALDGSDLQMKFNPRKRELEMVIPTTPVVTRDIDAVPVSGDTFVVSAAAVTFLIDNFTGGTDLANAEMINLKKWVDGFGRTPAGSFAGVRRQLNTLAKKVAPYAWVEAEEYESTTFGQRSPVPGSSEQALVLTSRIESGRPHSARYAIPTRVGREQEVWIAAEIPESLKGQVRVLVAGQSLVVPAEPVARYGRGLGWYKVGTVNLPVGESAATILVPGNAKDRVALDVLMVSPGPFTPQGPEPPLNWVWQALNQVTPPPGRG